MQKSKLLLKKLLLCLVAVVMCLSPILLAGCGSTNNSSGGGNGGGSSGGGSSSGSGDTSGDDSGNTGSDDSGNTSGDSGGLNADIDGKKYLSNYKISYRPSSDDDIGAFVADIKVQVNQIAFDIMRLLFAQYGPLYIDTAEFNNATIISLTLGADGNYKKVEAKAQNDAILSNAKPLFSQDIITTRMINDSFANVTAYKADSGYSKYFNHANAIFADYDFNDNQKSWNWNGGCKINDETTYQNKLDAFVNNLVYRKKLELALLLISAGYDITPTGSNYLAYKNGADMIDSLRNENIDDIEFYKAVDEYVFNTYYRLVDHSGYTDNEISYISSFILNEIIGTELSSLDDTKYLNVYTIQNGNDNTFYPLKDNLALKYNKFLTEETFLSFYYTDTDNDVKSGYFFNDIDKVPNGIEQTEVDEINDSQYYASKIIIIQSEAYPKAYGNQVTLENAKNVDIYYDIDNKMSDAEKKEFYEKLIDINSDGQFTADYWDFDNDDNTNFVMSEEVGNETWFLFSVRKQYFKNYANTSYEIVKNLVRAPENSESTMTYAQRQFDYDLKYPIIPASFFADYINDDILLNENGIMNMPTGYKRYQSVVVMPKKTFNFKEFYMFLTRQVDTTNTTQDFDVTIFLRYYDATTNSFATWGGDGAGSQFYNCGTVRVTQASELYEIDDPICINSLEILSSAKIKGTAKGNCTLQAFSNLPSGNAKNPTMITKNSEGAKMFKFVDLPNGQKTVTYSSDYLSAENRTSYMELLFATDNNNNFQFAILPTEVN